MKIADRMNTIEYAIRDVVTVANRVRESGRKIYNLNIGDPVIFDLDVPKSIKYALAEAAFEGHNNYVDSRGIPELRDIIAKRETRYGIDIHPDQVMVTSGVSEAILFVTASLAESGREILLPGPCYPPYITYCNFFNGKPVEYKLDEENGWNPDLDDIRKKVSDSTNAILISSPNNPTGVLYDEKNIREIIDIAGEYDIPVISDEIYDLIVYEKEFRCPASVAGDVPVIGMNSFSKAHMSTGWRLGYMYFYDPEGKICELKESIERLARIRLCANTPAQYAAYKAMVDPGNYTDKMVDKLRERRDYSVKRLNEIPGVSVVPADGAFYLFPKVELGDRWNSDKEFVLDLLEETGVCLVYGSGFGNYGKDHVRVVFLPPVEVLREVFDLVEGYVRKKT
ncbi:MAG: aminotransferase class I/II-fold pyridoxal phosphate-dependent enzyme [Promethearchaeota archaeon]